ncbi:MAG TPA: hypothetical protein VLS28_00555 [Candidatus Sulfomarinibacteraceae bacterium]|nr:hypothetical protein [Candidatus Sulfomarinibacteraceae bacterium]
MTAVLVVVATAGVLIGAVLLDDRLTALEAAAHQGEARLTELEGAADRSESRLKTLDERVAVRGAGVGTTARIRLGYEHQPPGGGRFGGLQAFVETGTTAAGCVASVSETNIGNFGPFDVLCTPRAPTIDGRGREGILIAVYRPLHEGELGAMFPPFTIVEVTVLQPGATRYAPPVVCVIGAPGQC